MTTKHRHSIITSGSISPEEAQDYANKGLLVIATWENPNPEGSGHLATVRPTDVPYNPITGPTVANVGKKNKITSTAEAFGTKKNAPNTALSLDAVEFYYYPINEGEQ